MAYEGPALGDKGTEESIDAANRWMRSQPWYMEFLRSIGQDPSRVKLNDMQKQQLGVLMAQNGLPIPEKDEVDPAGNINPKGHKLRNFLTAAAVGGAALTGIGLAGVGPLAGLGGAAGATGATGAASAPALAAGIPSAIGGASALTPLTALGGTMVPGAGFAPLTGGADAGVTKMLGLDKLLGGGGNSNSGGGGILSRVGNFLTSKGGNVLGAIGEGIGNATQAAGQNRINAQDQNMRGIANYENELATRMKTEESQRNNALKDVYRAGWYDTRQASPNNTRGLQPISQQTMDVLHGLASQGTTKLANAAQYDSNANPALAPYKPSTPSTLEQIGTYAAPTASILSSIGRNLMKK